MRRAPWTTCALVTMKPSSERMIPEPVLRCRGEQRGGVAGVRLVGRHVAGGKDLHHGRTDSIDQAFERDAEFAQRDRRRFDFCCRVRTSGFRFLVLSWRKSSQSSEQDRGARTRVFSHFYFPAIGFRIQGPEFRIPDAEWGRRYGSRARRFFTARKPSSETSLSGSCESASKGATASGPPLAASTWARPVFSSLVTPGSFSAG